MKDRRDFFSSRAGSCRFINISGYLGNTEKNVLRGEMFILISDTKLMRIMQTCLSSWQKGDPYSTAMSQLSGQVETLAWDPWWLRLLRKLRWSRDGGWGESNNVRPKSYCAYISMIRLRSSYFCSLIMYQLTCSGIIATDVTTLSVKHARTKKKPV